MIIAIIGVTGCVVLGIALPMAIKERRKQVLTRHRLHKYIDY